MRWTMPLQPVITVASPTTQEVRFAIPVGEGVTAVALVNVYRNTSVAAMTFTMLTASHTSVRTDATNSFWLACGQGGIAGGGLGLVKFPLTDLGEWLRYDVSGLGAAVDFSIAVELCDRRGE